jgi:hypothetical protein
VIERPNEAHELEHASEGDAVRRLCHRRADYHLAPQRQESSS